VLNNVGEWIHQPALHGSTSHISLVGNSRIQNLKWQSNLYVHNP